jgi:3-methyladenine DNA glycosylase AlkD
MTDEIGRPPRSEGHDPLGEDRHAVTADGFVAALRRQRSDAELPAIRKRIAPGDEAFGLRMRDVFATAKQSTAMPLDEVERLFASEVYEVRLGALCILDFRARARRCDPRERERLSALYLDHHDRITTWDMVDRAAPSVVGRPLVGRSCAPLHELARSGDPLRRRTAMTAPLWFVRYGGDADLARVLPIAAILASDPDPVVHMAVGIALKHAGARDPAAVHAFLDEHEATMARAAVRSAKAKLPPRESETRHGPVDTPKGYYDGCHRHRRIEERTMSTQSMVPSAAQAGEHLKLLLVERALADVEGLGGNATYMADLDDEITATRAAYVGAAVTDIAMLRGRLSGPLQG